MSQSHDIYSEKVWTRDDGQIDGYTFRGKRNFGKALEGLKCTLIKGVPKEIENLQFKALDSKIQGAGLEIVVEVKINKSFGKAFVKIYGPKEDIKKENSVTVTKSKESDSKYVVIVAEKIIKPLMNEFLSGKRAIPECIVNAELIPKVKMYKCSFCDKTCKTSGGLKGHITKMHLNSQQLNEQNVSQKISKKRKGEEEITEVVESIIESVINSSEDEGALDEDLANEKEEVETLEEKKYTKVCNSCDFQVEAIRNYISVQRILQHKELCSRRIQCVQCDIKCKDQLEIKRHMRDVHSILTSSTSPPLKKKKIDKEKVSAKSDISTNDFVDLSESLEEMEIDEEKERCEEIEIDKDMEVDILAERSRIMDEKVIAKQKKYEEEMEKFLNEKEEKEQKEKELKPKKSIKQKKKKRKLEKDGDIQGLAKNLKEVPDNCKKFVNEGDLVYVVPGNGACGPNSAAAHLFEDEIFGPNLRKFMNAFFAKHFYKKYIFKTPCSPESPFRRKVKGNTVQFKNPEELIYWLKNSEDAMYMWTDSEDLSVISDMYQMKIKIITSKGINDENPTENWIYPDKDLAEDAELKNVEIRDMVLLHENDVHFNLVVPKDSNLVTMGPLSYRQNFAPINKVTVTEVGKEDEVEENAKNVCEILVASEETKDLKKELKLQIDRIKKLEKEYNDCEKALKDLSRENEKLKLENKDLKEIINLESDSKDCTKCNSRNENVSAMKEHKHGQHEGNPLKCEQCGVQVTTKVQLDKHIDMKHRKSENYCNESEFKREQTPALKRHIDESHVEKEYNCDECPFQGTTQFQLNKHLNLKHRMKGHDTEEVIKCKHCDDQFSAIWNLMNHRKLKHINTVRQCQNYQSGKCRFTSEKCWWRHDPVVTEQSSTIKCFNCGESFTSKSEMMKHRKLAHRMTVSKCAKFLQNKCPFMSTFCWFLHENSEEMEEEFIDEDKKEEVPEESVFQKVSENLEPPIIKDGKIHEVIV